MSALFGQTSEPGSNVVFNSNRPAWYDNTSKRVIPNHLVPKKKMGFQLSTATTKKDSGKTTPSTKSSDSDTTDFSIISFGSGSLHGAASKPSGAVMVGDANNAITLKDNNDFPLYNDNEDLPPGRTLYDLNDEVIIALNKPAQHTGSFINKDPRNFVNAFSGKNDTPHQAEDLSKATKKSVSNFESAVLVFGYPEHMASQVIAFFSEFGRILENFEASNSTKYNEEKLLNSLAPKGAFNRGEDAKFAGEPTTSAPIFSGKSWVKLTYDNPSSAFDALQESGSVFNGILIGVVPYSKDAVEKLQQRKLSVSEDIGGGFQNKNTQELSKSVKGNISESKDPQAAFIKRLEVKDGSEIFLKANADGKDQDKATRDGKKLGIVGTLTNYFFGFHDL